MGNELKVEYKEVTPGFLEVIVNPIVGLGSESSTQCTITDSKGNTYTEIATTKEIAYEKAKQKMDY